MGSTPLTEWHGTYSQCKEYLKKWWYGKFREDFVLSDCRFGGTTFYKSEIKDYWYQRRLRMVFARSLDKSAARITVYQQDNNDPH